MPPISLCRICFGNLSDKLPEVEISTKCSFCFGLLTDEDLLDEIASKSIEEYSKIGYDGDTFILTINVPASLCLRELIFTTIIGGQTTSLIYPKDLILKHLLHRIFQNKKIRPSLSSDLVLTISFINDEFMEKDSNFLFTYFPSEMIGTNRKRQNSDAHPAFFYSKIKINGIWNKMNLEKAIAYNLTAASTRCSYSISFERNTLFFAGRYCKFSRTLPQTPWSSDENHPENNKDSVGTLLFVWEIHFCFFNFEVSERLISKLVSFFDADSGRFSASGREDIDVRMLGTGRPFCIHVINAKKTAFLKSDSCQERLSDLAAEVNSSYDELKVNCFQPVLSKQVQLLTIGQEDKKKTYLALCFSKTKLEDSSIEKLNKSAPIEIFQKTVIRVLKRRPLIDRKRTIFYINATKIDDFHFSLRLETQAGTYVKEFVHSDFGRTRPSVADLMGLELGTIDIIELDVEAVDFQWPPSNE